MLLAFSNQVLPCEGKVSLLNFVAALQSVLPRAELELLSAPPQAMIDGDEAMLQSTVADGRPRHRIWISASAIVASLGQTRHREFPAAAAIMGRQGWMVARRASGGTAFVHDDGMVNVSCAFPAPAGWMIDDGYKALAAPIITAATLLGRTLSVGRVSGACCPGRHDIIASGRKVGGTSMVLRQLGDGRICLAHASIAVAGNWTGRLAAITAFEELLGSSPQYRLSSHTSLATCAGQEA